MKDEPVNWASKKVEKILYYFVEDTLNRVIDNMKIQKIGLFNPNGTWDGVGDLERSIHATVVRNAGGNKTLINFFYLFYGKFVEVAVERNLKYVPLPAMTSKEAVERPDGGRRLGKGFLHSQIRRGVAHTLSRIAKMYTYSGAAAMWQTLNVGDENVTRKNELSLEALARELGI